MQIKPPQVEQEIKYCMIRNEIENVFFKVKLFYKLDNDFKNRFMNFNFTKKQVYDEKWETQNYDNFVKLLTKA